MGVKELREAFNAVGETASPPFSCIKAFLRYEHQDATDFQRLDFEGRNGDGAVFTITSDRIRPGADVIAAATATAERHLKSLAAPPPAPAPADPAPPLVPEEPMP